MRIPKDIIVPPKEIKETIDKTISYVIKNGKSFEERLLNNNKDNKFDFILKDNPHHSYYTWKLSLETPKEQDETTPSEDIIIDKPQELEFLVDLPPISAHDLDIIKTTALYIAHNGNERIASLLQYETKLNNRAQFEFLNTTHSLHKLFQTYVTQYKKVIQLFTSDEEQLPKLTNKFDILTTAYDRAQYISQNKVKEKNQEQRKQEQKLHYASIDWQDFVLVGKIEFDAIDEVQELSVPLTREELITRSLESKSRGIELSKVSAEAVSEPEEGVKENVKEGVKEDGVSVPGPFKGMKIKAAGASRLKKPITQSRETNIKCPITGKLIAESEFDNHLKSLLRDPRYKQEQENYIRKNFTYASNITTDQVYENIKRLVRKRSSDETTNGKRKNLK